MPTNSIQPGPRDTLDSSCLLLTGATGFLCSHLLLRLVQRYSRILAIARGSSHLEAKERVIDKMDEAASSLFQAPDRQLWGRGLEVYAGDITLPDLGLSADDVQAIRERGVTAVWHFAGSLKYEEKHRRDILLHNVTGTRHTADLAVKLGVRGFIYVSTAFVAGRSTGLVPEQLSPADRLFNNLYEESKSSAEHLLMQHYAAVLSLRIMRPGIVVGPSTTLRTGGSD